MLEKYSSCLLLNLRVMNLALRDKWLGPSHVASSYDSLAPFYEEAWLENLKPATERLLGSMSPDLPAGRVLDLGCGTGYSTQRLLELYPGAKISGVDLSASMLSQARLKSEKADWIKSDMLEYILRLPDESLDLVFSAWAMGYSKPAKIIAEAGRVLKPRGCLAFVVNYADTLEVIFTTFKKCMARFPDQVRLAAWPDFPKTWESLSGSVLKNGFKILWHENGHQEIRQPAAQGTTLSWLLHTGVLAGFDQMLPLSAPGPVAQYFEEQLGLSRAPLRHHFAAVLARKI